MSIVDGTGLIIWEGGYFEPGSDLLRRVQWAFARIRADGGTIVLNEAGRPYGVPGDVAVGRANKSATMTASGVSTVYYQWGRYLLYLDTGGRYGTPSAANPALGPLASEHTQGIAVDCDARDVYTTTLRAKYFAQVGMKQTISSESWHWAIRSNPTVDLSSVGNVTPISDGGPGVVIPDLPEEGVSEMAEPIYAKGDKEAAVYALYLNANDSNNRASDSGAVYSGRRKVEAGEWAIIQAIGFPHPKQNKLVVIPQAMFDAINKVAGSL